MFLRFTFVLLILFSCPLFSSELLDDLVSGLVRIALSESRDLSPRQRYNLLGSENPDPPASDDGAEFISLFLPEGRLQNRFVAAPLVSTVSDQGLTAYLTKKFGDTMSETLRDKAIAILRKSQRSVLTPVLTTEGPREGPNFVIAESKFYGNNYIRLVVSNDSGPWIEKCASCSSHIYNGPNPRNERAILQQLTMANFPYLAPLSETGRREYVHAPLTLYDLGQILFSRSSRTKTQHDGELFLLSRRIEASIAAELAQAGVTLQRDYKPSEVLLVPTPTQGRFRLVLTDFENSRVMTKNKAAQVNRQILSRELPWSILMQAPDPLTFCRALLEKLGSRLKAKPELRPVTESDRALLHLEL